MLDENTINEAYKNQKDARTAYQDASEVVILTKAELEIKKANGLLSGIIEGKNAEMREAFARALLSNEYERLDNAEKHERMARYDFDVANAEVSRVQALLRLMEALKE